jgi:hypothetical protein
MNARELQNIPVHIGLHKAGSTFLQHNLLPLLFPTAPFDKQYGIRHPSTLEKFMAGDVHGLKVLSSEKFSGTLQPEFPGQSYEFFLNFLEHAKSVRRKPLILLILREHSSYLKSAYLQRRKKGMRMTFLEYLNLHSREDLSWMLRIQRIEESGMPLLVLDQEDLLYSPIPVVELISNFWECKTPDIEKLQEIIDSPRGYSNISPKTSIGIELLAKEAIFRKTMFRLINFCTFGGCKSTFQNIWFRDMLTHLTNRIEAGKIETGRIPKELLSMLEDDWSSVQSSITRPGSNDQTH